MEKRSPRISKEGRSLNKFIELIVGWVEARNPTQFLNHQLINCQIKNITNPEPLYYTFALIPVDNPTQDHQDQAAFADNYHQAVIPRLADYPIT